MAYVARPAVSRCGGAQRGTRHQTPAGGRSARRSNDLGSYKADLAPRRPDSLVFIVSAASKRSTPRGSGGGSSSAVPVSAPKPRHACHLQRQSRRRCRWSDPLGLKMSLPGAAKPPSRRRQPNLQGQICRRAVILGAEAEPAAAGVCQQRRLAIRPSVGVGPPINRASGVAAHR